MSNFHKYAENNKYGKRRTLLGGLNVGVDGQIDHVETADEGLELTNVLVVRMIVWKFVVS
ncbi:hypothetical protein MTR_4g073235 [Medicago truncatula]|uniref:Uncharacterized protein n=1 Tax=Medicago truncatula TaxID=3880 RepID=A0A072UX92_MEDTR|nr:hypothetical protein MTR_4g073235 [Medicago truncatula]